MDSTLVKNQHFSGVRCVWRRGGKTRTDEPPDRLGDASSSERHLLNRLVVARCGEVGCRVHGANAL